MGLKKGVCLIFVIVALLSAGTASASFSVDINEIKPTINGTSQAIFEFKLTNNEEYDDTFRIRAPEIFWSMQSDPLYHYFGGVDVKGKSSQTVKLLINPIQNLPTGRYRIEIEIDSLSSGITQKVFPVVELQGTTPPKDYIASVAKTVTVPDKIDPRKTLTARIDLQNRNPKRIPQLEINAKGELFQDTIITNLEPLEKKTIFQNITINPLTKPRNDTITWTFSTSEKQLEPSISHGIEIVAYSQIIETTEEKNSEFLKTTTTLGFRNDGNTIAKKNFETPTNIISRIFTSTDPAASVINSPDGNFLSWELNLKPQETKTIKIVESYRPILLFLILCALIAALYFLFRSPVTVKKEVAVIGIEEGGISDLKVILHVKNRTGKNFDRITIVDKIPTIATVLKTTEVGSLTPTKITQTKEGILVKWELEKLEKYEEMVFSYTIKSRLSILGGLKLPQATARFFHENKERKTASGAVAVKI